MHIFIITKMGKAIMQLFYVDEDQHFEQDNYNKRV